MLEQYISSTARYQIIPNIIQQKVVDKKSYLNFFLLIFEHGNLYLNGLPEEKMFDLSDLLCLVL